MSPLPFARYLARRVMFAAILIFTVSSASLLLTRAAPGDPAREIAGVGASNATLARIRAKLGLDQPIVRQYTRWLGRAVRLDFGESYAYGPVAPIVRQRAANTAMLATAALVFATLVGLPLGVFTGTRRGGILPGVVRTASVLLLSLPPLLTSLVLVFIAARTQLVPVGGMSSLDTTHGWFTDVVRHLPVPALSLALPLAAMLERMQSQAMREAMSDPCIQAARARGVAPARLVWRDAFRLAGRTIASIYGLLVGILFSGSFIVENVTAWPGLGRLMVDALRQRDVYLVAGVAAAGAVFLAVGSLASDVAVAIVDPRVRGEVARA